MLRKFLMTTVAATALAGSAYAADLPSRRAPPPAYIPPVPIFTWTGFYIGANAGGAFRTNNNLYNNALFFGGAAPVFGFNNGSNNGRFIGGGQAGVNYQVGQFVFGVEGDGQALVGGRPTFPGGVGGGSTSFLGTVRGRGGLAFDRLLVYGTGGVAFGNSNLPTTAVATVAGIPGFFTTANGNNMRVGYAVGAGLEYAFAPNWSVKAEYLFTDLGRNNRAYLLGTGPGFTVTGREQNHIVRAGINYHFNWFGGPRPGRRPLLTSAINNESPALRRAFSFLAELCNSPQSAHFVGKLWHRRGFGNNGNNTRFRHRAWPRRYRLRPLPRLWHRRRRLRHRADDQHLQSLPDRRRALLQQPSTTTTIGASAMPSAAASNTPSSTIGA